MINVSPLAPDKEEYCGNINCDRLHVPYLRGITVNEYKKRIIVQFTNCSKYISKSIVSISRMHTLTTFNLYK